MQGDSNADALPVFVFPASLTVYIDDKSTHKRILTLYNPYDTPLSYQVLSNAPRRFKVMKPVGILKPRHYIDIVVRHLEPVFENLQVVDKLRIQIFEESRKKLKGIKDVEVTLMKGLPEPSAEGRSFEFCTNPSDVPSSVTQPAEQKAFIVQQGVSGHPSIILLVAVIICLIGLLLPTEGEPLSSQIPEVLHLSANVKIVIAYILGLLTFAVLHVTN